ncbi:hypothetical protein SKAU_G00226360 [Synaphobranchus kaupii]|uniref:Uncharacterized protein n=1 Tax=Synaphobranchus kaupii TaxID=118154 RepID=A0A9Q1IRX8_SYNKA|nr:hypothetical protein SKAU_G00226360 [Synaphobranchus kaupii]
MACFIAKGENKCGFTRYIPATNYCCIAGVRSETSSTKHQVSLWGKKGSYSRPPLPMETSGVSGVLKSPLVPGNRSPDPPGGGSSGPHPFGSLFRGLPAPPAFQKPLRSRRPPVSSAQTQWEANKAKSSRLVFACRLRRSTGQPAGRLASLS